MIPHEAELDRLARTLLDDAAAEQATDVHLNPTADALRLRYRVDGRLRVVREFPSTLRDALPQAMMRLAGSAGEAAIVDGRIRMADERSEGAREYRLSVMPSVFGPNVVLRTLDLRPTVRALDDLGMPRALLDAWRACMQLPGGLLVVTGPTGCGKTTTLYASLAAGAAATRNTITVEDPVECLLDWTVQTPATAGFAATLRGVLTQDPDVVMCGEVRDEASARLLCEMGLTGHLVLTAMHTNDGPEVLTRLVGIGLPAVLVGSAVQGVLAQRLVRKVCAACRRERPLTAQERGWLDEAGIAAGKARGTEGKGCEACAGTGFRGRTAVFHLLRPDDEVRNRLSQVERGEATLEALRGGCTGTLRRNALEAALEGTTTLQEAHWITQLAPMK